MVKNLDALFDFSTMEDAVVGKACMWWKVGKETSAGTGKQ